MNERPLTVTAKKCSKPIKYVLKGNKIFWKRGNKRG